jgi:hypothetical protein
VLALSPRAESDKYEEDLELPKIAEKGEQAKLYACWPGQHRGRLREQWMKRYANPGPPPRSLFRPRIKARMPLRMCSKSACPFALLRSRRRPEDMSPYRAHSS